MVMVFLIYAIQKSKRHNQCVKHNIKYWAAAPSFNRTGVMLTMVAVINNYFLRVQVF